MNGSELLREEWDFGNLLTGEERAAAIWEYARESETLRKADCLDTLPQTREVQWLGQLSFKFGKAYLTVPWLIASKEWHEALPDRIKREREQFLRATTDPESREIMARILATAKPRSIDDPIEVSDRVGASHVLRGVLNPNSPRRLIEINVTASKKEVLADIEKIYDAAQREGRGKLKGRGKDKPGDWRARLEWLGTLRLKRIYTARKIAKTRKETGDAAELETIERKVKRDVQRARQTFGQLFPFLPPEELR